MGSERAGEGARLLPAGLAPLVSEKEGEMLLPLSTGALLMRQEGAKKSRTITCSLGQSQGHACDWIFKNRHFQESGHPLVINHKE